MTNIPICMSRPGGSVTGSGPRSPTKALLSSEAGTIAPTCAFAAKLARTVSSQMAGRSPHSSGTTPAGRAYVPSQGFQTFRLPLCGVKALSLTLTLSIICDFVVEVLQMVMSRSGGESSAGANQSGMAGRRLPIGALDRQGERLERRVIWRLNDWTFIGERGRRDTEVASDKRCRVLAGCAVM